MKILLGLIYNMLKQYIDKIANKRLKKPLQLPAPSSEQLGYSSASKSLVALPGASYSSKPNLRKVTVPQNIIPLEKEGILLDRLYNDIFEFAMYYAGEFTKRQHSHEPTCSFFIIPKGDQSLYIQRHRDWVADPGEYRWVYTLFVSKNNSFQQLQNFSSANAKTLYERYEHQLERKVKDQEQINTINQLNEFVNK
jgi:hypothetical protein